MIITQSSTADALLSDLKKVLEQRIKDLKERIVKEAVAGFEKELREIVGRVTLDLSSYYSVERLGGDLRITVHIQKD